MLEEEIQKLSDANGMQKNSVRNLTRFVISALEYSGWFEKKKLKIYGKSAPFLLLTQKGNEIISKIENSYNLKGEDIDHEQEQNLHLADIALLCMLKRANFDVDESLNEYTEGLEYIKKISGKSDVLFSPYQFFSGEELELILPQYILEEGTEHRDVEIASDLSIHSFKSEVIVESKKSDLSKNEIINRKLQKRITGAGGNINKATHDFVVEVLTMKQSDFYPLIADLLGFIFNREAFAPSADNNNMRYDVMVPDEKYSIPVEVKSPTEEEMLSVKAIRQALENAVVFSYVLYLIGKYDYKVPSVDLQKIIRKWIFMSTITGFYTGSTETEVEKQFADLRDVHNADEFMAYLDSVIKNRFTDDYFTYSLPSELNSSSATSPAWYGYIAAINVLGTPMLFSTAPLSQYFVLGTSGDKNSVDKHHIFPKHYLEQIGYDNDRDRNQIANFTYLDYATNIDISDAPPAEYVARYKEKLGEEGYKLACAQNALPENFEQLSYPDFLNQRRILMAQIVKNHMKNCVNREIQFFIERMFEVLY